MNFIIREPHLSFSHFVHLGRTDPGKKGEIKLTLIYSTLQCFSSFLQPASVGVSLTYLTQLREVRGRSDKMVAVRERTFPLHCAPCNFNPTQPQMANTCHCDMATIVYRSTCHSKTAVTEFSLHINCHLKNTLTCHIPIFSFSLFLL